MAVAGTEGLTLLDLAKSFGGTAALSGVSLRAARGEVIALMGPNGAGKSTLLRAAAGITRPTGGRVLVDGLDLAASPSEAKRKVGWVPDAPVFYGDLSAAENLEFFGRLWGMARADAAAAAARGIAEAGLTHRANDAVGELSHGMRQRLSIARATMHAPSVLLLDEPFEGLDAASCARLVEALRDGPARALRAVVLATHQADLALACCDKVAVLDGGALVRVTPRADLTESQLASQLRALGGGQPAK